MWSSMKSSEKPRYRYTLLAYGFLFCFIICIIYYGEIVPIKSSLFFQAIKPVYEHDYISNKAQIEDLKPGVKYALVTVCITHGYSKKGMVEASLLNKKKYCNKYDDTQCFFLTNTLMKDLETLTSWSMRWNKLDFMVQILNKYNSQELEILFWQDCDTLIMDDAMPISKLYHEYFQKPHPNKDFLCSMGLRKYNTGSFMVKNTEWTRSMLTKMLRYQQYVENYRNRTNSPSGPRDQEALSIYKKNYAKQFKEKFVMDKKFTKIGNSLCPASKNIYLWHNKGCHGDKCRENFICIANNIKNFKQKCPNWDIRFCNMCTFKYGFFGRRCRWYIRDILNIVLDYTTFGKIQIPLIWPFLW